jgi:pimeloyl-ACP methyl ester carboxylesterase
MHAAGDEFSLERVASGGGPPPRADEALRKVSRIPLNGCTMCALCRAASGSWQIRCRKPAFSVPTNRALVARLAQNIPDRSIAVPVLIVQGLADPVVPPAATNEYVGQRFAAGQRLEYWTFAGLDHGTIVQPGTSLPEPLIAWTAARFANEPRAKGCARRSF